MLATLARRYRIASAIVAGALLVSSGIVLAPAASAAVKTFQATAGTLGAITDNSATPRSVQIPVSGFSGPPADISVSFQFEPNHTWVGDVAVTLTSPGGVPHTVFHRPGVPASTFGHSSNVDGPYTFRDGAATNWSSATAAGGTDTVVPAGTYRTEAGDDSVTSLRTAFGGIATANGTWTLAFSDGSGGDTGGVSAASLTLTELVADETIKRAGPGAAIGNGIRNTTAGGQRLTTNVQRGGTATFVIAVQNDNLVPAAFRVKGCVSTSGFSVRYATGTANITGRVTQGTFSTGTLAPGGTKVIRMTIRVLQAGPLTKLCSVRATGATSAAAVDVVRGTVRVV